MAMEAANSDESMLKATETKYGGVIIDSDALPQDGSVFLPSLKQSLMEWKNKGKRGVWLKVPLTMSGLVPLAIKEGFEYHHAEPTYAMLVTWLAADTPSTIPANASHKVGVGAFVMNANEEVLAVQENSGVFQGAGMPTGAFHAEVPDSTAADEVVSLEHNADAADSSTQFLTLPTVAARVNPRTRGPILDFSKSIMPKSEQCINAAAQMKEAKAAAARRKQQTKVEKKERRKRKEIEREEVRRAKEARTAEAAEARTQKLARAAEAAALKAAKAAERLQARRQKAERAIQASEERARKEADRAHVAAMELTLATERAHRHCARAAETA